MIELVRLFRYTPKRSILTVLGVALGFFSLTIMISMAVHFHLIAKRFDRMARGKLFIREESGFLGGGAISIETLDEFSKIKGVDMVVPVLLGRLRKGELYVFGLPELIVALSPGREYVLYEGVRLLTGRWITDNDENGCVAGADIVREFNLKQGGILSVRGKALSVVGTLERTGGYEDKHVIVSLTLGQKLMGKEGLASFGVLLPSNTILLDELPDKIAEISEGLEIITPHKLEQSIKNAIVVWDVLSVGLGVIAVLIGGLCIVTIMMMSVMERVREIGIKRVLGASRLDILTEFLKEACGIAMAGGIAGVLAALGFVKIFGIWLSNYGMTLFELSPVLFIILFLISAFVGVIGGIIPAYIASGYKPLQALKGEL